MPYAENMTENFSREVSLLCVFSVLVGYLFAEAGFFYFMPRGASAEAPFLCLFCYLRITFCSM